MLPYVAGEEGECSPLGEVLVLFGGEDDETGVYECEYRPAGGFDGRCGRFKFLFESLERSESRIDSARECTACRQ